MAYTKCIAALCYDLIYLFVYLFIYLSTRVERLSRGLVSTAQYRVIFSSDRITSKTQTRLGLSLGLSNFFQAIAVSRELVLLAQANGHRPGLDV